MISSSVINPNKLIKLLLMGLIFFIVKLEVGLQKLELELVIAGPGFLIFSIFYMIARKKNIHKKHHSNSFPFQEIFLASIQT